MNVQINVEDVGGELERMRERVAQARQYLNFEGLRAQIAEMESKTGEAGFWDDAQAAQEHMRQLNRLKVILSPWEKLGSDVEDAMDLAELAEEDESLSKELISLAGELADRLEKLETLALMNGEQDVNDCYLHIHAGAGGTESCDWASMLLRMYSRWIENRGFSAETIELMDGDEAGIRSATLLVKGDFVYGLLKAETGIHRLVRISPFDANSRRHTSFGAVYAWPVVDDTIEVDIRDEDLKIDTYRSSGAGGQHVNKTSSAVRITHLPTKIVVQCQNERSQHQNKAVAMKMLRSRLYQLYSEEAKAKQEAKQSEKRDISWGNQIRSYVFQPYQLVKDTRTGCETGNIQAVMDGELDEFIEAYLRWAAGVSRQAADGAAKK